MNSPWIINFKEFLIVKRNSKQYDRQPNISTKQYGRIEILTLTVGTGRMVVIIINITKWTVLLLNVTVLQIMKIDNTRW